MEPCCSIFPASCRIRCQPCNGLKAPEGHGPLSRHDKQHRVNPEAILTGLASHIAWTATFSQTLGSFTILTGLETQTS